MDRTNYAQSQGSWSQTSSTRYDPVHAVSSEALSHQTTLPPHASGQQARLVSDPPGRSGLISAATQHGRLPPLQSALASYQQSSSGAASWNQRGRGVQAPPSPPSPGDIISMRLLGGLGQAGRGLGLQASLPSRNDSTSATQGRQSPTHSNSERGTTLFPSGFHLSSVVDPLSFHTTGSHSSSPAIHHSSFWNAQTSRAHSITHAPTPAYRVTSSSPSTTSERRREPRIHRNRRDMPPAQEDRDNRDGRDNRSHVHVNERHPFGGPGPARPTQGSAHPYRGGSRARLWASAWAKRSLKSVKMDEIPENEKSCTICYNEYGERSPEGTVEAPLRIPQCGHIFGDHCIKKWLSESEPCPCCPYCRTKFPVPAELKLDYYPQGFREYLLARLGAQPMTGQLTQAQMDDLMVDFLDSQLTRPTAERRPPPSDPGENRPRTRVRVEGPDGYAPVRQPRGPAVAPGFPSWDRPIATEQYMHASAPAVAPRTEAPSSVNTVASPIPTSERQEAGHHIPQGPPPHMGMSNLHPSAFRTTSQAHSQVSSFPVDNRAHNLGEGIGAPSASYTGGNSDGMYWQAVGYYMEMPR